MVIVTVQTTSIRLIVMPAYHGAESKCLP